MSDNITPPLSRLETSLLAAWQRAGRVRVTLADVQKAVPDRDASVVAARLVHKGLLHRVGPGVFLMRELQGNTAKRRRGVEFDPVESRQ